MNTKLAEKARRDKELKDNGRILSLRPSVEMKMKTKYTRKNKHKKDETQEED